MAGLYGSIVFESLGRVIVCVNESGDSCFVMCVSQALLGGRVCWMAVVAILTCVDVYLELIY
jgi:hypothetical protein